MSEQHIRIIESVAGDIMDLLGYERHLVKRGAHNTFSARDIKQFNAENDQAMKAMSKNTDPDDLKRRERQLKVLREIKEFICHPPVRQATAN